MIAKKLKLYVDKGRIRNDIPYVFLLYPFLGDIPLAEGDPDRGRMDGYLKVGAQFFELVGKDEADAFLMPHAWEFVKCRQDGLALAEEARTYSKPIIVFFCSDSDEEIPIANAIVFRTSLYRSRRKPREFALPGWSVDFLNYSGGNLAVRQKETVPSVGFCGYVDYHNTTTFLRQFVQPGNYARLIGSMARGSDPLFVPRESRLRGRAVRNLLGSSDISTKFVFRDEFFAGAGRDRRTGRIEYARNIIDSDYTVVARGAGNFSYRFYEVLSCGRIPLFIDTDCVLPFHDLIDWKHHTVWVDQSEVDSLPLKLQKFHSNISSEEFSRLQMEIRKLYEEWISPAGFFKNLWRCVIGERVGEW